VIVLCLAADRTAFAQPIEVAGTVRDQNGAALAGVSVEVRTDARLVLTTLTDLHGRYRFAPTASGRFLVSFSLQNFASVRRELSLPADRIVTLDVVLSLALSADVVVTGRETFLNLADAPDPALNLIGIAQSASQGAVTARQIESRPLMRPADVLETVPGVVISQHSGEGKANQYYLRGFNLDHGTDFATTVARAVATCSRPKASPTSTFTRRFRERSG
jgi:hypothetical protein